jgi:hypothetical protein
MTIEAVGEVTLVDPVSGTTLTSHLDVSTTVQYPGIALPRLLGLFTWPTYGTQPADGRPDAVQDSLLLILPADSPLAADKNLIGSTLAAVQQMLGSALSLVSAPLPAGAIAPFGGPGAFVARLTPLLSALGILTTTLAKLPSDGYVPVNITKAIAPSAHSPVRGGVNDIRDNYYWHWYFPGGHDAYHDNAQSFLLLAPPGGRAVIYCGHGYQAQADDGNHAATLTLTAGGTCLVGIKDFRPAPGVVDPVLSPGTVGPLAAAQLVGRFTNEQPPTTERDSAWTNSFEFL